MELYFDSDGEKLRSEDLFSGFLHRRRTWISVQFSQADLVREWPKAGAAAFVRELASRYRDQRDPGRRYDRERSRREWIDRFAAKQRQIRRWIPFVEIGDVCARAAALASFVEEREARDLAYRRLVESISRGEFEKNGKSQILMLVPRLHVPIPSHRLTEEYFQGIVNAYGISDFSNDSELVIDQLRYCWVPSELCREWFERHHLAWPGAFNPQVHTVPVPRENRESVTEPEILQPPTPPARAPQKGRPGRLPGSGSFDDSQALREMLRVLANGDELSVHAAARLVAESGTVKKTGSQKSLVSRLRKKFATKFGTSPRSGETWRDIEDELKSK
jgi:hypothetical protein